MEVKSQFDYLVSYLDTFKINYQRNDDEHIKRIYMSNDKGSFSVIYGYGTYGYYYGLLEVSVNKQEPLGFLSSVDVIKKYKEWLNEE